MKPPRPPRIETRRAKELEAELVERARAWIPSWAVDEDERDVGRALLKIAARFGSEVAERLDRAGEKLRLGFLDWLAVQGEAARPARLPVVFKLTDSAREARPAEARTRLQVEAAGTSVTLETESEVLVLPRGLQALVGVDGAADAFYLAPPGMTSLAPLEPLPVQWQLKSFAAQGATTLQLDPEQGLAPGMVVELGGSQYGIASAKQDIVTLDRPLEQDHAARSPVDKATAFAPFDGAAHNAQQHALYIGHGELLDIEVAATIEVRGTRDLARMAWHYWGKRDPAGAAGWQALPPARARADGIVLAKPAGAMELLELAPGRASRWLRASARTVEPDEVPPQVERYTLRVNCRESAPADTLPAPGSPPAEGMANTTPLMLDDVFFPLGKEPRQFDAFYLGSQEAFSKKGAQVSLDFKMADPDFLSLTSLRSGPLADLFLAGVAADGQLHLFAFSPANGGALARLPDRLPLRPPAPQDGQSVELDRRPAYRIPVWMEGNDVAIAVAAKGSVWLRYENTGAPELGGWTFLEAIGPVEKPEAPIEGLVYLADGAAGLLCALREEKLFVRSARLPGSGWQQVDTKAGTAIVKLKRIAPVCHQDGDRGNGTLADGLVGADADGKLYAIALSGVPLQGSCVALLANIAGTMAPAAVRRSDGALFVVAVDQREPPYLMAWRTAPSDTDDAPLGAAPAAGAPLDMNFNAGMPTVVVALGGAPGSAELASWSPFAADGRDALFKVPVPAPLGAAAGAATLLAAHVLVPTSNSQVIVAGFDLARRLALSALLRTAIIAADAADRFAVGDRLAIPVDGGPAGPQYELGTVAAAGVDLRGRTLYEFDLLAIDASLFVYPAASAPRSGDVDATALDTIGIAAAPVPDKGDVLLVTTDASTELYTVREFDAASGIASLDRDLVFTGAPPATVSWRAPEASRAILRPLLHLDAPASAQWPAALPDTLSLFFPGARPGFQAASAHRLAGERPELLVLARHWESAPPLAAGKAAFIVDGAVGEWKAQLGDTSTNPELSWEYWNGKGWWKLASDDRTLFLKKSGVVSFEVPSDIASSDWAGKTNYWIRARLVGGDYGHETATVTTRELGGGKSEQTVRRSTAGIRAPSVTSLQIAYSVCDEIEPNFVLVRDSGSLRDQSDANRTGGALVEAFVPLALALGRLADGAGTAAPALERAIYLGFDAPLLGEPVKLLLLVEERDHDAFAPLRVEALVADRFVPLAVSDATRALGESGILSLAFAVAPAPRELFGQTLSWLRLAPAAGAAAGWKPKLLGAYLNGVWASAAETLTRELIGSSQGEPDLTLYLARPPVLRDSLELRVREPLGDEEREALTAGDPRQVLGGLENQAGDWVLWRQVTDPGDEAPGARVYALDEASGEIRFGDGRHGRIPPIGRDCIMAFSYRRTTPGAAGGPPVPGNAIAARTALNLVSPIDGVETVFAASQAAGGAPAEDTDRVLRFAASSLRRRDRALTARDLEDLVLQASPDIVQARCLPRRGFVQLAVVKGGPQPVPGAAQLRELQRLLLDAASPLLGAHRVLRLRGPVLRSLRVELRLRVANLDDAGAVARHARQCVAALFDTATGGVEGGGWPLGENPTETDVALALADVPLLLGIASVALQLLADDGGAQPWPDTLGPIELPWLAQDGVRVAFEADEVAE